MQSGNSRLNDDYFLAKWCYKNFGMAAQQLIDLLLSNFGKLNHLSIADAVMDSQSNGQMI